MFRLFRRKIQTHPVQNPVEGKIGTVLAKAVHDCQRRLAAILSKKESRLTLRQKKRTLVIFCIAMSSLSGYWIIAGIFSISQGKPDFLQHQAITVPQKTVLPDSLDLQLLKQFQQGRAKKSSQPDSVKR